MGKKTMNAEQWMNIGSDYQVSDRGRVKSWKKETFHIMKQSNNNGYMKVGLWIDGVGTVSKSVHQLVMEAFVGPCPKGLEVDHIDGDKTNNHLSNLRYVTHQYNVQRCFTECGLVSARRKEVIVMDGEGRYIASYPHAKAAADDLGVGLVGVYDVLYGRQITSGGYTFQWKDGANTEPTNHVKRPVVMMSLDGEELAVYGTSTIAGIAMGVSASNIRKCCKGVLKTSAGYCWKYKN